MLFKKILPWLVGILILLLAFAAVPLTRLWMFGGQMPGRELSEGDLPPGMGSLPDFSGPMMSSRAGSLMGGYEIVILPLFFVALFLFTVWAFLKIVRASAKSATRNNLSLTGHICPNCGRAAAKDWRICPYCATDLQQRSVPPAVV
ncbi:MAG: hypothetical protein AB9891_00830 [Anaerolineaceae bacterium]